MHVAEDEWEDMKRSSEQYDDRIVEVHWDPALTSWRMMRFRDDKPQGNHRSVVENIINSIADGVEKEALLARSNAIRTAWKARLGQPQPPPVQAHPQTPHFQGMRPLPLPPINTNKVRSIPHAEFRYGPFAPSPWSKVGGPLVVSGMKR